MANKKRLDLVGEKFGRLLVLERAKDHIEPSGRHRTMWKCICSCGSECVTQQSCLRNGSTKSCGCLHDELCKNRATKHGKHGTRLYKTWRNMVTRCYNANNQRYKDYGGRGITICEEWKHDFQAFYDWSIANGYSDNLTIERIDNNGNYEPSNCTWITKKEQNNNKRSNHLITYNGKTQNMRLWADELGIKYQVLNCRINKRCWNIEKAFTQPVKRGK